MLVCATALWACSSAGEVQSGQDVGLGCYTPMYDSAANDFAAGAGGWQSRSEAIDQWWLGEIGSFRNDRSDLTMRDVGVDRIEFIDEHGHAQVILEIDQTPEGQWRVVESHTCPTT